MPFKILGGTNNASQTPLCVSCRKAIQMSGDRPTEQLTICGSTGHRIPFPIFQCSIYDDARYPSLYDMENSAFYLRTDSKNKIVGFCSAKEWREKYDREGSAPSY